MMNRTLTLQAAQQFCNAYTSATSKFEVYDECQVIDWYQRLGAPDTVAVLLWHGKTENAYRNAGAWAFPIGTFCRDFIARLEDRSTRADKETIKAELQKRFRDDFEHDLKNLTAAHGDIHVATERQRFSVFFEAARAGLLDDPRVQKVAEDLECLDNQRDCEDIVNALERKRGVRGRSAALRAALAPKIAVLVVDDQYRQLSGRWKKSWGAHYDIDGIDTFDLDRLLTRLDGVPTIAVVLLDILDADHREAGIELFEELIKDRRWQNKHGSVQVVFFSQEANNFRHYRVSALKRIEVAGFLAKDASETEFVEKIDAAHQRAQKYRRHPNLARLTQQLLTDEGRPMIYSPNSAAMENVLEQVVMAGLCNEPVLIRGESGTGKELIARHVAKVAELAKTLPKESIFSKQPPALSDPVKPEKKPLIKNYNIAAAPTEGNLLYGVLFGYKKGSYTGAIKDKAGLFKQADVDKIPIFLDEIGDAPAGVQVALLRVLQDKEIDPLGADKTEHLEYLRLITATNADFERKIEQGEFRLDLYHRLCGIEIALPPLRERLHDIPLLARYFLDALNAQYGRNIELDKEETLFETLQAHHWPGNIRELEQLMRSSYVQLPGGPFRLSEQAIAKLRRAKGADSSSNSIEEACYGTISDAQLAAMLQRLADKPMKLSEIKEEMGRRFVTRLGAFLAAQNGGKLSPSEEQLHAYFGQTKADWNQFVKYRHRKQNAPAAHGSD